MSKSILIADNEPNFLISLEYLILQEGYHVLLAHDGEAALKTATESNPDLILLDIGMSKKNGFEVCHELRNTPKTKDIKIIMVSAKGRDIDITKGKAVGADDYVVKPFSTRKLIDQIHQCLEASA